MINKLFRRRRILVITDDNIKNYPLSPLVQTMLFFGIFGFISWVSFSSGQYFSYKQIVSKKEAEVYQANLINLDLQTKIDNLQSNLVKLNEYFSTVKEFDYNKDKDGKKSSSKKNISYNIKNITNPFGAKNIDKRVAFSIKNKVVDNINVNATERIATLKSLIAMTGLKFSDSDHEENMLIDGNGINFSYFKNQGGPNTDNISDIKLADRNIDDNFDFSENIGQLMYLEKIFNAIPFISPMKRYYISSTYGKRIDPITRKHAYHFGTDFAGPIGAKIVSTAPGIVKFSGRKGNYGNFIEIDHGFGINTRYGHLKKIYVNKGDRVERDQLIALQGNSGRSSGPHLHYEIRYNDKPYNPEKFVKAGRYVF
jgi:murein DD-endopeptidase MepM/ murein hydrolase activator NlpD